MPAETWDFDGFYRTIQKRIGLDLTLYKQEQLRRRIKGMAEQRGMSGLAGLAQAILSKESEAQWFLDRLAINVTELYRNPEKWAELQTKVLPELLKRNARLKCWSAGCSIGAEAYTLASIFATRFSGRHTILGTDIDRAALDQASRGEFETADMRCVPPDVRRACFEERDGRWRPTSALRQYITFRPGNLLADRFDRDYDLILCRNVVIYFNDAAKEDLYRRFYEALKPGGMLFVGSTERIFSAKSLGFESPLPFFYRKPTEGEARWRSAS